MADIKIYGVLRNCTPEGTIATADQIKDTALGKMQADINKAAYAASTGLAVPFDGTVETGTLEVGSSAAAGGSVVWVQSLGRFAYLDPTGYLYDDWLASTGKPLPELYMMRDGQEDAEIMWTAPHKGKLYTCEGKLYAWSAFRGGLVELSAGGSGAGFYNVTVEQPLASGYYTLETAVAAMANAGYSDEQKRGAIITFEASAGKWLEYRFEGTDISSFLTASAWNRYGGADAIKKITVTRGTATEEHTAGEDGGVTIDIPQVEVDQSVNENSTNPVSGKAVAAKMNEKAATYGTALRLNTIGEGGDKAYSFSLLNEAGEVLNTSDMFAGGGGGTVATTKVVLTRVTPNKTVKSGDEVKLTYTYDHQDTATGESTGNPGRVTVTVTQGANTNTLAQTVAAGSTNTVNVTKYMGVGTNTVRVRVETGEGSETQVAQVTWSINVVQLTLSSSFSIATAVTRGQTLSIPYALSGAGAKTLRCYVDGDDTEDRSITASTANGSFSIATTNLAHGTHTVQLVVELELTDGSVIKSNSILLAVGIREAGNNTPLVSARFDYADGTIIEKGTTPYIQTRQYDNYTLQYTAYNPRETPTQADVYVGSTLASSASIPFTPQSLALRASNYGEEQCKIVVGATAYNFRVIASQSELNISEPTDGLTLKLTAQGRSNSDVNREEWSYNGIRTVFEGFKWGGDGWTGGALRLTDTARATVLHRPLEQPEQNVTNAMAYLVKYKVSEVVDEEAEVIRCVDADGTGFVITTQEARMVTRGKSELGMKMAAGEVYEVAFVSFPKSVDGSSDYEKLNTEMVYLYINGVMSGCVQRSTSDSIYQASPAYIELGAEGATVDVYLMRAYDTWLSDSQVLDCYMIDQDSAEEMMALYEANDVVDENGNVTVDSVPDGMRYIIITGRQANGVPTVLQAAVNNDKDPKYDVDEMLCVVKGEQALNFLLVGGCIRLQGTSSLAYPVKNYRIYLKNASKVAGLLYLGCDEQGVGGELQDEAKYSFRLADANGKRPAPVDCFCLKADFAESSSSHNTGMAKLVQDVLTAAGELTPAQAHCSGEYEYDVRTTIDGEPCYLFYRGSVDETPQFLGKFNWNNDKSTEAVFGFCDIPGYHDQAWVAEKFGGANPTECWEFLNNDYAMGMFLDDDFDARGDDGEPEWLKVFEARFPDDDDLNAQYAAGTLKPKYLEQVVKWVKSTESDGAKFKAELANYFDVDYLCDFYMFTDILGCFDQRVKNMMLGFWYKAEADTGSDPMDGMRGYFIFYDNDTILGVRNDGRLKYPWDVNEETTDPELSTAEKTVYAYAGHDSVLWRNLREQFADELSAAYVRIRAVMSNATIFNMFDTEQSAKFCERIYNLDAQNKYVEPKTLGVEVNRDGAVTNVKYSYLEAMQGSRKAHRHWWVTNRLGLFDARYGTGQYTATDISFKGNSAAGATVRATAARDFYFEFRREGTVMTHDAVAKDSVWSYSYGQTANIGTIFHLYGGEWMKKLDLGDWGGFTDMSLPQLPVLEELILGNSGNTYALTELVLGTKLPMLRKLDVVNYTNLPSLDLSGCNRIEDVNAAGCTSLSTIAFAEGAALTKLHLPVNFQTLVLRSMQYISWGAITFDGKQNLTGVWIENCALIDGLAALKELFALGGLKYVRICGLEMEGDGSDLQEWYDAGLGGIDAQGNTTNNKCKLVGTYKLTKYLDDGTYNNYVERFDELNIRQPEYTMIEFDDTVGDDANVSNPDNETGYKYGTAYAPSGHISKILARRHRALAKVTKLPTTRTETVAGVEVTVNNGDGELTYYPLDDADSNKYADGSAAKLDGSEGDWMLIDGGCWGKGVNDYLGGKHYSCYSSRGKDERPSTPACTVVTLDDIKADDGSYWQGMKVQTGKGTLEAAMSSDSAYSLCRVAVGGRKRVRWPSVPGANLAGALFVDAGGAIVDEVLVETLGCRLEAGMYLVKDVPAGAVWLYFSILNTAEFDKVVLSDSDRIEDMEPEWVWFDEFALAVAGSSVVGTKLRSCITGGTTVANLPWTDMHRYSQQRGMQQVDAMMHSWVANLFYAKYGRRDSQRQCGAGQHSSSRTTGGTAGRGMEDTMGYEAASAIDSGATYSLVDGVIPQYAWYKGEDEYGRATIVQVNNTCCLGYEDIYGNKYDMMDGVDLPNDSGNGGKWRIWMPDGTTRMVKGTTVSGNWITAVAHGLWMDVVPVGSLNGSSSTYYCDTYGVSTAAGRVVYRGQYNAYANGGLSYAYANNDASNAYSNVGSRLAFRGKIVKAESVAAYKAMTEKA